MLEFVQHDWQDNYPGLTLDMLDDASPPKIEEEAYITCCVDVSHACGLTTGRSLAGILLFVNKTLAKWYSKRQNTVESSTYGSELVAAIIPIEMIIEYRYKLRMVGFKVTKPSVLLIDNLDIVTNSALPSSSLKKKYNAIAYHKICKAVAA